MRTQDPGAAAAPRQPAGAVSRRHASADTLFGEPSLQAPAWQAELDRSPRMQAQRGALQAAFGGVTQRVVLQRLSDRGKALVFAVDSALKRVRALVLTDTASSHFGRAYDFDLLATALDRARAELARLQSEKLIEESGTLPSLNFLTDNQPAYISGNKLYLNESLHELDLGQQAAVVTDLLGGEGVGEQLIRFVRASGHEGVAAADDKETFELNEDTRVYRVANAASVRSYVLSGISRVSNKDGWTELGCGFYASPDREGAAAYAATVGKPHVLMELRLTSSASCRLFTDTSETDGKTEQQIKDAFGESDAVCDATLSQIKFHNPFYRESLQISRVWTMNEQQAWVRYASPQAFVTAYEVFLIGRHKTKALAQPLALPLPPTLLHIDDVGNPSEVLKSAPNASPAEVEAIAFIDAAVAYEKALGAMLSTHGAALAEAGKLASAVWESVNERQRAKLGSKQSSVTGMVGAELSTLKAVVDSGNLRERLTLVYNGYVANLFGRLERPEAFNKLRDERDALPKERRHGAPHPQEVSPPLSEREWFEAVNGEGKLSWESGQDLYHYPMTSPYQETAEELLTPVSTGPSGTAYGIFQVAQKVGAQVDPQLLRLAILGWMLPIGDHSFHEIMTACAAFDSNLTYDPAALTRYRSLPPLSESDLRAISPSKLFPDEVATVAKRRALSQ